MSLKIIRGRSGSGKTSRLLYELKKSVEKDPSINKKRYVIVPDQFSYTMEKNILESFGEKYIFAIQVVGFKMLSVRILERVGGIKKKILSPIGREMMISHAQNLVNDSLRLYKGMNRYEGFSEMISSVIKEFKNYDISPEFLEEKAKSLNDGELKYKISDIAKIYKEYENQLSKTFIDSDDQLKLAVSRIKDAEFLKDAEFYIDEFSDFTPMQLNMIREMIQISDVYVTLTLSENLNMHRGVFTLPLDTENRLMKLAEETNTRVLNNIDIDGRYGRFSKDKNNPELAHIEEQFYNYPNKVYEGKPENIKIFKAQNRYEEIEYVAKDISRRVRDEGMRYSDIAILLRDLPSYSAVLKSVMNEYDIPVFIDSRKEIGSNPLPTFLSAVFEIKESNYSYESVFKMLKTGLFDLGYDEEDEYPALEKFENYIIANGIKGHMWKETEWHYSIDDIRDPMEEKKLLNQINEIKDIIYTRIEKLFSELKEASKTKVKAEKLYNFLVDCGCLNRFENWIEEFKNKENYEKFKEYSQIEEALMDILDQMAQFLNDTVMEIEEFGRILRTGLSGIKISLIPATLDQVIAGDISRVRSSKIKGIYIVGTNEQVLPRNPVNVGILTDSDREKLQKEDLELSKNARERSFFEQFYVYNALTIASEYLYVTYPVSDNDGKAMRPSMVVGRLKRLFPDLSEESSESYLGRQSRNLSDISSEKDALRELIGEMRRHKDGRPVNDIWKEVYAHFIGKDQYRDKIISAEEGLRYTNYPNELRAENIESLYGNSLNFTVSRLEKYAQCPYAYFVQYGINARERKEFKLENPELGSLMHGVLDKFSRNLSEEGRSWPSLDKKYIEEKVDQFMVEELENSKSKILTSSARYRYLSEKVKRVVNTSVETIKSQFERGKFVPKFTELEFGKNGVIPGVTFDFEGNRQVTLDGKIDRVDIYSDEKNGKNYIRIVDYKSSQKELKLDDIYYGLQMQLLLYLDIILRNSTEIMKGAAVPGAMLYFTLERPVIDAEIDISEEELKKKIMKELKFTGLILDDEDIITALDDNELGVGVIIPEKNRNKGKFITEGQFALIREYLHKKILEISSDLLDGKISITPYKKGNKTACDYCKFKPVCQFDTSIRGNEYNILTKLNNDEVFERIGGGDCRGEI